MTIIAPAQTAEVGPMLSASDIEHAIVDVLRDWLGPYIGEYERQHGLEAGGIPTPRGWVRTGRNLQKLPSDQLPCVVLMAGGILVAPVRQSYRGEMTLTWVLDVGIVSSAAWGDSARDHAHAYAVCLQSVLEQRPVGGRLELTAGAWTWTATIDFRGEAYDANDFASTRMYAVAAASFNVQVEAARWSDGGPPPPASPPADPLEPLDPWVEVATTDVTVENTPPGGAT